MYLLAVAVLFHIGGFNRFVQFGAQFVQNHLEFVQVSAVVDLLAVGVHYSLSTLRPLQGTFIPIERILVYKEADSDFYGNVVSANASNRSNSFTVGLTFASFIVLGLRAGLIGVAWTAHRTVLGLALFDVA